MMFEPFEAREGAAGRPEDVPALLRQLTGYLRSAQVVGFLMHSDSWGDEPVPGTNFSVNDVSERFLNYAVEAGKVIFLVIYEGDPGRGHFPPVLSEVETLYTVRFPYKAPARQDLDILSSVSYKILEYEHLGGRLGFHPTEAGNQDAIIVSLAHLPETHKDE